MLFLDGEAHRPVALGAPAELARHAESAKVRDFLRARAAVGAAHPEAA
jgi:phospholipid/cholesterol/gamma-HCH transport system ATP-binding protein